MCTIYLREIFPKNNRAILNVVFQSLFSHLDVIEYKELTLSANLAKEDLDRYRWNYGDKPQPQGSELADATLPDVVLRPMAIKTYLLTVKSR